MNQPHPIVSVIIPVYNAENHLRECLDSVIEQSLREIEIICVDDGSADSSLSILREYETKDKRVKVLTQKNQYAGVARNHGMEIACGQYYAFMDADDYYAPDALKTMYIECDHYSLDVLKASFYCIEPGKEPYDTQYSTNANSSHNRVLSIENDVDELLKIADVPWNGMYRASFVKEYNLHFNNLIAVNDHSFFISCIVHARRVMVIDQHIAFHRENQSTSLVGTKYKNYQCQIESYYLGKEIASDLPTELRKLIMQRELRGVLNWYGRMRPTAPFPYNEKMDGELQSFIASYDKNDVGMEYLFSMPNRELFFQFESDGMGIPLGQNSDKTAESEIGAPRMSIIQRIKNMLKRILPPPTKTFMREINDLRKHLFTVEGELSRVREENKKQLVELTSIREENKKQLAELTDIREENKKQTTEISRLYNAIPNKPICWHNEFERGVVRANWGKVTEEPGFKEKYLRLISGLDPQSIVIINRIISRQQKYLNSDKKEMELFTREEQEELRFLNEHFNQEIFKVADDLYAYRNYLLPINHFESSVFYFRHGLDDVKTLDKVKGKAILDVGGFIGDSVLIFSELGPSCIYTFEADPENCELLQKTLELNNITNAIPVPVALGDHIGTITFHKGGSSSGAVYREGIRYTDDIEVPLTTLDAFVAEHPMEIGLIKVDIEGGEPGFLEGAKKTICEQRPILLLSIYHNAHDFFELKPLLESWNLGYEFRLHKPTYGNATSETLLIAEILDK